MNGIGNVIQILQVRAGLIRILRRAGDLDHEPAAAIDCGANGGFTAHNGFLDIAKAGDVGGSPLSVAELDRARLGVELGLDQFGKAVCRAGKDWVTESIEA